MTGSILTLNAGSSSLKYALFKGGRIAQGQSEIGGGNYDHPLGAVLDWTKAHLGGEPLMAAGHRIVHGGDFSAPKLLDPPTMAALATLTPLAPLHQPHNLSAVTALAKLSPGLIQVGCFDTSFHHGMDARAQRLALPQEWSELRRYGFHGLSYEFIAGRLAEIAPQKASGRIIIAHLGSGASLCALKNGASVDTTMSLTPLDGLVMATRPGALDPGVLLYWMQEKNLDAKAIEQLLYDRSGLLGVSGISGDMRRLLASDDPKAKEAIELFVWRTAQQICALTASMGGLDGVVFTGGIGENSPVIRAAVCARLEWLGLALDMTANQSGALQISNSDSKISAWAIPTDEEAVIARHTARLAAA